MSSTVEVFFQGLVLWWMTAPGPYGVVPDFTAAANAHEAILEISSSQYADGNCPAGFTNRRGIVCAMSLSEAKKPGGVSMTFAEPASSILGVPDPTLCPIPKLQDAGTALVLRPEFKPPEGERNAGWVRFHGGTFESFSPCGNRDCARSSGWRTDAQAVTLTLGNLANRNEPLVIPLPAGARVTVSNRRSASSNHDSANDNLDWCLYFSMVTNAAAEDIPCPGRPTVPRCKETPTESSDKHVASTIACSNSQYP
jgi:hypothetical protein